MTLLGLSRGAAVSGSALFEGTDLIGLPEPRLRKIRGARIAMVFQDPLSSLHPLFRVGQQIAEAIRAHTNEPPGRRTSARSSCSGWWGSRSRGGGSTTTRTSSPAACASGR